MTDSFRKKAQMVVCNCQSCYLAFMGNIQFVFPNGGSVIAIAMEARRWIYFASQAPSLIPKSLESLK